MMMNRDKLNFWVRVVAIGLAAIFILSFVFLGVGSTAISGSIFDLFGSSSKQQSQGGPTVTAQDQIQQAQKEIKKNPKNADNYKNLAALYYNENQVDEAINALERGRKAVPKDQEIPVLLAQLYVQKAQAGGNQKLYAKAGDAYAAAAKLDSSQADNYYLAGQAYEQAGQPDQAIKYWNKYLDEKPKGKHADEVKKNISNLLKGGSNSG